MVQAELDGLPVSALLDCKDQICTSTTYYGSGKRKGWHGRPAFQEALALARRDYRKWMLEHGTAEALTILASTAPEAARALRQRVIGDETALSVLETCLQASEPQLRINAAARLGDTGLPRAALALRAALQREKDAQARTVMVEALGRIAGGAARNMSAPESVLDRADIKTASKRQQALTGADGGPMEMDLSFFALVAGLDDEELARLIQNLETADTPVQEELGQGNADPGAAQGA